MAKTPSQVIQDQKKRINQNLSNYVKSREFKDVADKALIDFVKRVKRGLMPDLGKIPDFSEEYEAARKRYKQNLGSLAKVSKSNATATGQMLESLISEITKNGFIIYARSTSRSKELSGATPKIKNNEVAKYYAKDRPIFDFSDPELERIKRSIRKDILRIVKNS